MQLWPRDVQEKQYHQRCIEGRRGSITGWKKRKKAIGVGGKRVPPMRRRCCDADPLVGRIVRRKKKKMEEKEEGGVTTGRGNVVVTRKKESCWNDVGRRGGEEGRRGEGE